MASKGGEALRSLEPWSSVVHKTSVSSFGWVKLGLRRTPLVGIGLGLSLLELVAVSLFLGVHAVYLYSSFRRSSDAKHFAKSFGELVHWDLALSLLFVPRNSIWQAVFSCSFERAIAYHRWLSNAAIALACTHGAIFHATWIKEGQAEWIDEALRETENLFGELALACYLIIVVMSLPWARRKIFELFRWTHIIFVPLFIGFIVIHHGGPGFLLKASISILFYGADLIYRLYSILLSPKSRASIVSAQKVCNDVVKLTIKIEGGRFAYSAGQYVFLTIPAVDRLQAHPFSISSAPPGPDGEQGSGEFTVHAKSTGDFTYRLLRAVEMRPATLSSARVEGPYGALSINPFAYRRVVFVAGGIGITPMLSVMRHMHDCGAPMADKVSLHWSVPRIALYLAFGQDVNLSCQNIDAFESHVYVTGPEGQQADGALPDTDHPSSVALLGQGRPDLAVIIANEVRQASPDRVAVLVCGPESMRAQVQRVCGRHNSADLHCETFEL